MKPRSSAYKDKKDAKENYPYSKTWVSYSIKDEQQNSKRKINCLL